MNPASKARELLQAIEEDIKNISRQLTSLTAQRREIARMVQAMAATRGQVLKPYGKRGRPAGKRTRTNWNSVITRFKGSFSINDLAKASGKAKPTVNQAIQIMKKAGKIKSTGKRGEYQATGAAKAKKATTKRKVKAGKAPKAKKQAQPKTPVEPSAS